MPLIKWFSSTDVTNPILGYQCYRVDKPVEGIDFKTWAGWFKLAKLLGNPGDIIP